MFFGVRSAAVLTTSYVPGTIIEDAHQFNSCRLLVSYTQGSLTSLEIRVRYSYDGVTWYQDVNLTPSASANTLSASEYTYADGDLDFVIDFPINCNELEISAKGTGTVDDSELAITAILSYV